MRFRLYIPVSLAFVLLLLGNTGCSTKKNTAFGRFWHGLNTKYNGYYNGNEAIKVGMQDLNKSRKDNYSRIIPTFDYGDRSNWSGMNANADRAIKKAVIMIKKHSMFINGKQYNKWIDDCYMLMGKANFFKLEHSLGVNQLKHVAENSEKQYTKDEAKIWMVRTYNEMGEYAESGTIIRGIDKGGVNKKLLPDYYSVIADYHIRQKEWEKALENLDEAIKSSKSKKRNARLEFIRGQIYEIIGEYKKAYESYEKVVKFRPEYVMEFQARINMARTAEGSNNASLRKTLKKMLKDGKNTEYLDQVYYAIAIIDLKEEKSEDAIKNLNKSLRNSVDNTNQQALSHLKLAEIYMSARKYELAQGYYDSTSVLLATDHPKYDEVMRLKENLTQLVENIRVVETQDSLQRLSKMDSLELVNYFTKYTEDLKKADEEAKNNPQDLPKFDNNINTNAKWYFTSSASLSLGANEFRKVWGSRPLEDNWRRQNKEASFLNTPVEDTVKDEGENPRYDPQTYMANVPKGDSAILASNEMIYRALYNIGTIYKDKILDYPRSIEAYEELETRAPKNNPDYFPIVYFQLYTLYKSLNKEEQMNRYKEIILTQYANSDYAQVILDPSGFRDKNENNDSAVPAYGQAYDQYKSGDYIGCFAACNNSFTLFPKSSILHRFALLKALCVDKISGRDSFKVELKRVVDKFGGTESASTAQRLINAIDGKKENDNPEVNVKADFVYNAAAEHFVIVYIPDATKKVDGSIGKIIEFNEMEFEGKDLSVSNSILPGSGQVILIRKFANAADAKQYIDRYDQTSMMIKAQYNAPSKIMAISSANFAMLMKTPSMADYQNFYSEKYK